MQTVNLEQAVIDLSKQKWDWMAARDVEPLEALFHEKAVFVHMGGTWGKAQELDVIRGGGIHYKQADIHYLGGTLAQKNDLKDQKKRLWILLPAGALGGLVGGVLLLNTGEKLFSDLVPFLILIASTLLAIQNPVRAWLTRRTESDKAANISEAWAFIPVFLAAIYGGYFGAGLSVILLAVLGLVLNDNLTRLNALKQGIAFTTNIAAALIFVFSGKVVWSVALVMAVGALLGGALGGKFAGRIKPATLRTIVVTIGFLVGIIYLVRNLFLS